MTEKDINTLSSPTDEELELINKYTRRHFDKDEVYVFSLTLCDNDVDRDFERFTVESLFELEKLFVGKTGIVDHESRSKNQTARVFKCNVEAVEGKKTITGDDYFRLTARAYIPVTEGNRETILAIDSGIKKEVSVGCAVRDSVCSICSKPMGSVGCNHIKGQYVDSKLCFAELKNPYDAYEWSFVAVPAQREAGVTKSFKDKYKRSDVSVEGILKNLESKSDITLSHTECEKLFGYINELKKEAEDGKAYRQSLEQEFTKLMALSEPDISGNAVKSAMSGMSLCELKEFISAYKKKTHQRFTAVPQLCGANKERSKVSQNKEFTI